GEQNSRVSCRQRGGEGVNDISAANAASTAGLLLHLPHCGARHIKVNPMIIYIIFLIRTWHNFCLILYNQTINVVLIN
ncbi:hypothetical protein, partial [Erwinia amylovora]|uniref:hypothetical protein n=1 Tax=Erwinia amylovora TaxID=552 RepID=UPI00196A30DF